MQISMIPSPFAFDFCFKIDLSIHYISPAVYSFLCTSCLPFIQCFPLWSFSSYLKFSFTVSFGTGLLVTNSLFLSENLLILPLFLQNTFNGCNFQDWQLFFLRTLKVSLYILIANCFCWADSWFFCYFEIKIFFFSLQFLNLLIEI